MEQVQDVGTFSDSQLEAPSSSETHLDETSQRERSLVLIQRLINLGLSRWSPVGGASLLVGNDGKRLTADSPNSLH